MGKATGKNRKKRPLGLGSNNKSLEKRELLKGERKEGKSVRVCWLFRGLSTPANEKLLSIFHHTRESFLDIPLVKWKCVLCRRE